MATTTPTAGLILLRTALASTLTALVASLAALVLALLARVAATGLVIAPAVAPPALATLAVAGLLALGALGIARRVIAALALAITTLVVADGPSGARPGGRGAGRCPSVGRPRLLEGQLAVGAAGSILPRCTHRRLPAGSRGIGALPQARLSGSVWFHGVLLTVARRVGSRRRGPLGGIIE